MGMNDHLSISPAGLQALKNREGFRNRPYYCSAGKPTIGYGTVIPQSFWDHYVKNPITREEAHVLLVNSLTSRFEPKVRSLVKVALTQNQYDALVSFTYNLGEGALASSTMLRLLNKGDYESAAAQFPRWCKYKDPETGATKESHGLKLRRLAEQAQFRKK